MAPKLGAYLRRKHKAALARISVAAALIGGVGSEGDDPRQRIALSTMATEVMQSINEVRCRSSRRMPRTCLSGSGVPNALMKRPPRWSGCCGVGHDSGSFSWDVSEHLRAG